MEELIPLNKSVISGEERQTVNARELHGFLENGDKFTTWIKERIDQFGFIENQDFVSFSANTEKPQGGRPSTEYFITLDMAKELSMVERNARGKQARKYFIACEKKLKEVAPQSKLDAGLMYHKTITYGSNGSMKTGTQARVTPKGMTSLAKMLNRKAA